jgi:hypothetical protein
MAELIFGVGNTEIVNVLCGPEQELAEGVTVKTADEISELELLFVIKVIFPDPDPPIPMFELLFVHEKVVDDVGPLKTIV